MLDFVKHVTVGEMERFFSENLSGDAKKSLNLVFCQENAEMGECLEAWFEYYAEDNDDENGRYYANYKVEYFFNDFNCSNKKLCKKWVQFLRKKFGDEYDKAFMEYWKNELIGN